MALTTKEIYDLNNSMSAAQNVALGTKLDALLSQAVTMGTYTATAGNATANEMEINTGVSSATKFIVQIFRSGVNVMEDAVVTMADGILTIADGSATYAVTAGDIVFFIVQ